MKHLLMLLFNLFLFTYYVFVLLLGTLWFGKLPKVSLYHLTLRSFKINGFSSIFTDKNIQAQNCIDLPREIRQFESYLRSNGEIFKDSIDLVDKKGYVYGETNGLSRLSNLTEKYIETII